MANIKICSKCGKIGLDQYDFYVRWFSRNDKYYYCAECIECETESKKETNKKWRQYIRNSWLTFLKELGYDKCSKCGYDKCFASLDFHHIDPALKEFEISGFIDRTFTESNKLRLLKELDKCVVLCANCHRELHWKEIKEECE